MSNEFVKVYHNAIPDDFCDKLIKQYDDNPQQYYHQDKKNKDFNFKMSFSQIHIEEHDIWKNDVERLLATYRIYLKEYRKDCNITDIMWPRNHREGQMDGYEPIRMKRYLPNDKDMFSSHVDVTSYETSRRFLAFFLYLDNNEAGQTTFSRTGFSSSCRKGSLLMFPPMWPWLHAGEKPINKPKYIVGSYLHYV